jgi:hypothetical protein
MDIVEVSVLLPTGRKQLQFATDPQSGRTTIRLDGRAVAQPMTPQEAEREVIVDGTKIIVRRRWPDGFDVDYTPAKAPKAVPVTPLPPRPTTPPRPFTPPKQQMPVAPAVPTPMKSRGKGRGIVAGIVTVILIRAVVAIIGRGGSSSSRAAAPSLEVTVFECSVTTHARFDANGVVKNNSTVPLNLIARVFVPSDAAPSAPQEFFSSRVIPQTLPPGGTGRFAIQGDLPGSITFESGRCKLAAFLGDGGNEIGYTVSGSAAKPH